MQLTQLNSVQPISAKQVSRVELCRYKRALRDDQLVIYQAALNVNSIQRGIIG